MKRKFHFHLADLEMSTANPSGCQGGKGYRGPGLADAEGVERGLQPGTVFQAMALGETPRGTREDRGLPLVSPTAGAEERRTRTRRKTPEDRGEPGGRAGREITEEESEGEWAALEQMLTKTQVRCT